LHPALFQQQLASTNTKIIFRPFFPLFSPPCRDLLCVGWSFLSLWDLQVTAAAVYASKVHQPTHLQYPLIPPRRFCWTALGRISTPSALYLRLLTFFGASDELGHHHHHHSLSHQLVTLSLSLFTVTHPTQSRLGLLLHLNLLRHASQTIHCPTTPAGLFRSRFDRF